MEDGAHRPLHEREQETLFVFLSQGTGANLLQLEQDTKKKKSSSIGTGWEEILSQDV